MHSWDHVDKSRGGVDASDLQQIKFTINNLKAELEYMKKMFSQQRLTQIDQTENKVRNMSYDVEVLKMQIDSSARNSDLEELNRKLQD